MADKIDGTYLSDYPCLISVEEMIEDKRIQIGIAGKSSTMPVGKKLLGCKIIWGWSNKSNEKSRVASLSLTANEARKLIDAIKKAIRDE